MILPPKTLAEEPEVFEIEVTDHDIDGYVGATTVILLPYAIAMIVSARFESAHDGPGAILLNVGTLDGLHFVGELTKDLDTSMLMHDWTYVSWRGPYLKFSLFKNVHWKLRLRYYGPSSSCARS